MRKISMLPSILTLCNFVCGLISLTLCLQSVVCKYNSHISKADEYFTYACFMIFIGMVFDMLDGRVARMTHSESQFGAELDSLADVCTFGIAPAFILATVWVNNMTINSKWWSFSLLAAIIYSVCAVLRLAIYNLSASKEAHNYFSGLPSPAAAGALISVILFGKSYIVNIWHDIYINYLNDTFLQSYGEKITAIYLISIYAIAIGLLMVSHFRFVHAANILLGKTIKHWILLFAILVIILLFQYPIIVLFFMFNGFMFYCLFVNVKNKLINKEENIEKDMEELFTFDGVIEVDNEEQNKDN